MWLIFNYIELIIVKRKNSFLLNLLLITYRPYGNTDNFYEIIETYLFYVLNMNNSAKNHILGKNKSKMKT